MVSILLCTYNRENLIRESIDSILGQTYTDFELLLVDDGSTDGTKELLNSYKDERIRLYPFEENRYYCRAANWGMQQMRGEYLAIANSDDVWCPKKLERQMEYLEKHPECGVCFTYSDVIDENGQPADEDFPDIAEMLKRRFDTQEEWMRYFFRDGNCLAHPSAVIPRQIIERVGGFHLLFCQGADLDMWIRILRIAPIYVVPEILTRYRCHHNPDDQVSGANELKAARFMNEHMLMRKKMMKLLNDKELIRYFQCDFRKKDASTHLELEIERAFLLMECVKGLPDLRVLGIEKFEEVLDTYQEEAVEVLEQEYQVKLTDIYQWNLEHFYVDFGVHVEMSRKVERQQELEREVQEASTRLYEREKELARVLGEMATYQADICSLESDKAQLTQDKECLILEKENITKEKMQLQKEAEEQQAQLQKELEIQLIEAKRLKSSLEEQEKERKRLLHNLEQQVLENVKLLEKGNGRRKRI